MLLGMQISSSSVRQLSPVISRIGRFYVLQELGHGSEGSVYLAHDPVIDRKVAIKTLTLTLPLTLRKAYIERLICQARAAGRLSHPNIVKILDAVDEGHTAWLAMEYLEGSTLAHLLATGQRFRAKEVASITWRLADALDHAHKHGVVHFDVKPSNIFLDERRRPTLIDFGIARAPDPGHALSAISKSATAGSSSMRTGLFGTPVYMSPEQANGKPMDSRSDIYSLGAVMYEMLTGAKPFNPVDSKDPASAMTVKTPSPPHVIDSSIPHELSRIAMKAMSKRPASRYQHAGEMVLDLKRYLVSRRRKRTLIESGAELLEQGKVLSNDYPKISWISVGSLGMGIVLAAYKFIR